MSDLLFVLIHSPLVGPLTWKPVAAELERRGEQAVVPVLTSALGAGPPYWQRHAGEVLRELDQELNGGRLVLVGHSGAGVLLPVIGEKLHGRVAAYVFVDASLPEDGKSRFDLFGDRHAVEALRTRAENGLLPAWNEWFPEGALAEVLPDARLRSEFLSELKPTPLIVYEEPVPVFGDWPDAPCSYLQLSPAYRREAEKAAKLGWPVQQIEAGHLHMLVDPAAIGEAILTAHRPGGT
jgi:pimeloyl-ACP methyl ester carboxylesterase